MLNNNTVEVKLINCVAQLPEVTPSPENIDKLSCLEIVVDTMKVTKMLFDPASDCIGGALGFTCCCIVILINTENDARPARRRDVIHANQIRANEANEANVAFQAGSCIGNAVVDSLSLLFGGGLGFFRGAALTCVSNNDRSNTIFGYERSTVDAVKLFDSCSSSASDNSSDVTNINRENQFTYTI